MSETWKDIKGFEGLYQVSNLGRIKRVERVIVNTRKQRRVLREQIMEPKTNGAEGYLRVGLRKDGKQTFHAVHRLVAFAFIKNPEGKPQVNHINENRSDNRVENLEWITCYENNNHGKRNENISRAKRGGACRVKVSQYLNGELVATYDSIVEASEKTGVNYSSIRKVLAGTRKGAGGFQWRKEL